MSSLPGSYKSNSMNWRRSNNLTAAATFVNEAVMVYSITVTVTTAAAGENLKIQDGSTTIIQIPGDAIAVFHMTFPNGFRATESLKHDGGFTSAAGFAMVTVDFDA